MGGVEAKIAADVGEDAADGLGADFFRDLLGGGEIGEGGIESGLGARGRRRAGLAWDGARRAWGWRGFGFGVEAWGGAGDLFLEQAGAQQTLPDAGEDQGDVGGEELAPKVDGIGVGRECADRGGELGGVVDEFLDEREQAAGAAWFG